MDTVNFEPAVPSPLTLEQKREFFSFTHGSDKYPPHLNLAGNKYKPTEVDSSTVQRANLSPTDIFAKMRLAQLASLLPTLIPDRFIYKAGAKIGSVAAEALYGGMGTPDAGKTLAEVEDYNRKMRQKWIRKDIFNLPNVGDLEDWYTDARFAQQHFTGTNPTTIERASEEWILHFTDASKDPADTKAQQTIMALASTSKGSLYMQDYSYFRKAAGMGETDIIKCEFDETYVEAGKKKTRKNFRYGCASVCLFYLNDAGALQPLAIIIDWRGSAEQSVTIYNRELIKRDATLKSLDAVAEKTEKKVTKSIDEAHDWAWRYGMS
jgi:hypothetical protein